MWTNFFCRSRRGLFLFWQPSSQDGERKSGHSPRRLIPRQVSKHVSAVLGSSRGKKLANCFFRIETKRVLCAMPEFFPRLARGEFCRPTRPPGRRRSAVHGCNSSLIRRIACQRARPPPGVGDASIHRRFAAINARTCGFSSREGTNISGWCRKSRSRGTAAALASPGVGGRTIGRWSVAEITMIAGAATPKNRSKSRSVT